MAMTTTITANTILNRVAAEVGIAPVPDPYGSIDPAFIQMQYLLNTAGEELQQAYNWEFLVRSHQITTTGAGDGVFPLPDDFGRMINQTGWERSENVPLGGPLSAQDWTYLLGRDLASDSIYASFRIKEGEFNIFPNPPPSNLDINFEYVSINWATNGAITPDFQDQIISGSDTPLFDKTLITRYVKLKYLQSAGFDTQDAKTDFNQTFSFLTSSDKGSEILNQGRGGGGFPYISVFNVSDTNFGL